MTTQNHSDKLKIIPSIAVKSGYKITCTNYFTKEISGYVVNDYDYQDMKTMSFMAMIHRISTLKEQKTT